MWFKKNNDAKFAKELQRHRYTNVSGEIIPMHHAFKTIRFTFLSKLSVVVFPALFMATLWLSFESIAALWGDIFQFWMHHLFPNEKMGYRSVTVLWHNFRMPFPHLGASYPSELAMFLNFFGTILMFMFTGQLFKTWTPVVYLVRAAMMVQWTASMYFIISPNHFPYELGSYLVDMMSLGLYLLFLIPLVYALVLYIFDFPLWWKLLMTSITIIFFIIFLPCQYMMHAWVIHTTSYMFLPIMYFMFAVLLDVLMFICFYSIAIAAAPVNRSKTNLGRYA